jgi:hypothetical protein
MSNHPSLNDNVIPSNHEPVPCSNSQKVTYSWKDTASEESAHTQTMIQSERQVGRPKPSEHLKKRESSQDAEAGHYTLGARIKKV